MSSWVEMRHTACWSRPSPTTPSTCSIRRASSRAGTRARSASRATRPTRSSASTSRASTPRRTAGTGLPERALETAAARGKVRERRLARPQGRHALLGLRGHRSDPSCGRRAHRLRQDHARPHRAQGGRGDAAAQRGAVPPAGAGRHRLRHLHARPGRTGDQLESPAPSGSRATCRARSSASISPASTRRRTARPASPQRALETAAREGRFEKEGWRVRKDGTRFWAHVVIDPIRDDSGLTPRLRQDHARHHRAQRDAGAAGAGARSSASVAEDGGDRPADRRRSRTTSTTC